MHGNLTNQNSHVMLTWWVRLPFSMMGQQSHLTSSLFYMAHSLVKVCLHARLDGFS